jgi:hypothetical protein
MHEILCWRTPVKLLKIALIIVTVMSVVPAKDAGQRSRFGFLAESQGKIPAEKMPLTPYDHYVVWTNEKGCSTPPSGNSDLATKNRNEYLKALHYACDEGWNEGLYTRSISNDRVIVLLELSDEGKYLDGILAVANIGDTRLDIDPSKFWIDVVSPDYKRLNIVPPEVVASSARNTGKWARALANISASLATRTATVVTNDGSTATISYPDDAARVNADNEARDRSKAAQSSAASIMATALKRHTLAPNAQITRYVYFENVKHRDFSVVHLPIGETDYIFAFDQSAKR